MRIIFLVCVFPHSFADYLQAIQATSVLACVFAILALFVFVAQLFTLPKGQRFTFTGILQFLSCKLQGGKITTCYLKKSWIYYEGGCVMSAWVQMTTKETSVILGATMPNKELSVHTRTSIWEYDMDIYWLLLFAKLHDRTLSTSHVEVFTWCRDPPLSRRFVYNDSSLHLHCRATQSSGWLRTLLHPGLDFLRFHFHLSHHLPHPAKEERVTGEKGGESVILFPVWIWDSE